MRLKWRSLNPPFAARKAEQLFPAAAKPSGPKIMGVVLLGMEARGQFGVNLWLVTSSLFPTHNFLRKSYLACQKNECRHASHAGMLTCKSC